MASEPNFNEIAATVIQGQINNAISAISKTIKAGVTKLLEIMNKDLTKYTAAKIKKCSYVRTPIINRDHSVPLRDIYVETRLRVKSNIVKDDDLIATLANNDSVVVIGSAGSGKSMFMRHLFLKLCNEKRSRIPLFFELRDINADKKSLEDFLFESLIGSSATITKEQFLDSLKAGLFSLILDGFDEIHHTDRTEIELQVRKIRDQCPDMQIIISSRPDPDRRLETWQAFRAVYVEPMTPQQSSALINRLEYDPQVKEKFLREAKGRLFQTHETFLSNPLLCILMLVTFEQTGHIPTKRHVFYEKAFDALFAIHDAAKEGVYKRKTYASLSVDDFSNCMSAFCIITYLKEQFVFSNTALRRSLQQALELEAASVNIDDLISDLIESTCLIQAEGTDFVFAHRSFQEYFAAVFISRSPTGGAGALLEKASARQADDVINLTFSINRRLVEREWVVPTLQRLLDSPSATGASSDPTQFLDECIGGVFMNTDSSGGADITIYFGPDGTRLLGIAALYASRFPGISSLAAEARPPSDREHANAAYVNMVRERDPRIFGTSSANVRFSKQGRPTGSRMIELTSADSDWLARTSIPNRVAQFLNAAGDIVAHVKTDAQSQEDILKSLTKGFRGNA